MQPFADLDANELLSAAQKAASAGARQEANRLWERVLQISPGNPQALFLLGQEALVDRNFSRASELLQLAVQAAPNEPGIYLTLATVARAIGNFREEETALINALRIDPLFLPARLAMGMLLERSGKPRAAARAYKDALAIAPPPDTQLPTGLHTQLNRARELVKASDADLEASVENELTKSHVNTRRSHRFIQCKNAVLGKSKIYTQQPHMLHFPELPAIAFYPDSDFPWLAKLEQATETIRQELLGVLEDDQLGFQPYLQHPETRPLDQWVELNKSPKWSAYYLWRDGVRIDDHCLRCPQTAALLESLPMLDIPGHGPTFLFSSLQPHTHIPPHTGDTNVRLIVHVPLIIPANCRFRVANETREWKPGKAWVFDDTIDHEAWNDSDHTRIILMCDVWNHYLSQSEREDVGILLKAIYKYYSCNEN